MKILFKAIAKWIDRTDADEIHRLIWDIVLAVIILSSVIKISLK